MSNEQLRIEGFLAIQGYLRCLNSLDMMYLSVEKYENRNSSASLSAPSFEATYCYENEPMIGWRKEVTIRSDAVMHTTFTEVNI